MASAVVMSILLFIAHRRTSALPTDLSVRSHGVCQRLALVIPATAPSAVYDIPEVTNDITTTAWAAWDAAWSTPHNASSIIHNTTISGVFNINAQLCMPTAPDRRNVLQIATHGAHYDSRYWDSRYSPEEHSYVDATLNAGYAILTYDRLGAGQSDILDGYTGVQAPLELEILHQLTLMARNGTLYQLAHPMKEASPDLSRSLTRPEKVLHIGHSFGSVLTSAFIATYGPLSDGASITGFLLTDKLASAGSTAWALEYAGRAPYHRPSGYAVSQKSGIQTIFFGGTPYEAFTPELLAYGDAIKQPIAVGEIASAFWVLGRLGPEFKGPLQYLLPEFDFYICRGDCKGVANATQLAQTYPNAAEIDVVIQPNTGHALPLHKNATAGFQLTYDFFGRHDL